VDKWDKSGDEGSGHIAWKLCLTKMNKTGASRIFHRNLFLAALAGAVLNFIAFYPGILHHDAWAYFDAAQTGDFTNWQPPLLGFLWIPLQKIWYGPEPMLVLFMAGYWGGFFLIARAFETEGRTLAWWTFLASFFPMALNFNGQLVKDISMAVCLLIATGLAACLVRGVIKRNAANLVAMWFFLFASAFMRANAFFALPPLLDLAGVVSSKRWASIHWLKRAVAVCLLTLLFAPAHIAADRYIFRVKDIHPISQLQILDIAGITYRSGVDGFQGFFGPDFVTKNRSCYTPRAWDVYGWGGCEEVYENLKPQFGLPLSKLWLQAIASDPLAYLAHRSAHVNRFLQFLCTDCKEMVYTGAQSSNQKDFTFEPTFLYKTIDWISEAINNSPLGPPYVWLLICLAWSLAAFAIPNETTRRITLTVALSGAMYGLAFAVIGIASDYRYIYWTMLCALIATPVIVARVLMRDDAPMLLRIGPLAIIILVISFREIAVSTFL
jgi:hypothetical protein